MISTSWCLRDDARAVATVDTGGPLEKGVRTGHMGISAVHLNGRFDLYLHSSRHKVYFLENYIIGILLKCFFFFPWILMGPVLFLNTKYLQPAHPKGNQSWIFVGRTDAEAETPIAWPPDAKNLLIWKDPDAGKDWRREEKGTTEDDMVGWYHWLNAHEFG